MVFAGSDPTGGAGIVADTLTLASLGCHPVTVVTAVTAQDTAGIKQFSTVETELVIAQARAILEDMPIAAFKIGMVGTVANLSAIAAMVEQYPDIPLVLDPVQASGRGDPLADESLDAAFRALLIPQSSLITPNSREARVLAQELMSLGSEYVLITGTHEPTPGVVHRLYSNLRLLQTFEFERLPGSYHGSGCTLAAACAATLAHGLDVPSAVDEALNYTWETLKHGLRPGKGQALPDRLFWSREDEDDGGDDSSAAKIH
jgi:hydroxymethylpyrimidine/phosphomethylpyrimidine kinase